MDGRHTITLTAANAPRAHQGVDVAVAKAKAGAPPLVLEIREGNRTDEQNDALHGLVSQIMKQRQHHNGVRMNKELWKAVFMEALGEEVRMIPKLDGDGFFPLGLRTSKLPKDKFSQLIELILAWCAREGLTVEHFDGDRDSGGDRNPVEVAA